jgi:hypothetical protein
VNRNRMGGQYLSWFAAIALAIFGAACGGGGVTPEPPPPAGPFSATTLNGSYSFVLSGQDGGGFFTRVGSFTANGTGGITGGVQDFNSGLVGNFITLQITSGTYTIGTNGKGTLTIVDSAETMTLSIVMTSATSGLMTQTDGSATASGNFIVQDTSTFAGLPNNISGPYVFDFAGVDPSGFGESIIGQFTGSGGGTTSTGVADINDDFTPLGPQSITGGVFARDSTFAATSGRGTFSFTVGGSVFNFVFYAVGADHLRMMRLDFPAASLGDAIAQTGTIPTTASGLSGSFVFVMTGSSLSGSDARGGRVTLNGGAVSNIQLDDNDSSASGSGNSNHTAIPAGSISAATYAIDSSGNGRGTMTFTDSSAGVFSFIFYLSSPTSAVIQDISSGLTSDGSMLAQTGVPTLASAAGNWAFNWSGLSINSSTGILAEEDFVGQYTQTATGGISGGVDFTELSANSVVTGAAFNGSLGINGDGTGRNPYSITIQASPSSTLNFVAYFIDPNTFFVVGTDTHRIISGIVQRNF